MILWLSFISRHRYWSDREQVARFSCLKAVDKCNSKFKGTIDRYNLQRPVVLIQVAYRQVAYTSGIGNWLIQVAYRQVAYTSGI